MGVRSPAFGLDRRVLDGRLGTARYAEPLLAALPAVPRVHEIADVEAFFGRSVELAR